ncbi:MAG: arylsulfatase [Opitutales bacterium]|nr:arylsulfatase [Opitutales bacterium]
MKFQILFYLSLFFPICTFGQNRPNVIIVMADDMGWSDIGCYGSEIETPNLDRLAKNGLRFTQFYNTGRCCPTRASLLTGTYPHQAGIGHMMNDTGLPGYQGDLGSNVQTIAEVLTPAKYSTYLSGKWHVTPKIHPGSSQHNWPRQRGFDRFYGTIHGAGSFFDPNSLTRDNKLISPHADKEYKPKEFYYTDAINDHATRFINEHENENPFFLYVAHTAPHWPMHALPEDIQKYKGRYDGGWEEIREARYQKQLKLGLIDPKWKLSPRDAESWKDAKNKKWEIRLMEVYAAMVDRMDQGLGRIINALEKRKMLENTLIIFIADNGGCAEGMGRKEGIQYKDRDPEVLKPMKDSDLQMDMIPKRTRDGVVIKQGTEVMTGGADTYHGYGKAWANVSNTPFREYKHWVHEGGISAPLVAHWPKGIASKLRGKFEHQPAHLIDLMATCVELGNADYPKEVKGKKIVPLQGVSLGPAFSGKKLKRENPIFWEHEGNRAIRIENWKLVAKGSNGEWELYDLEADRSELNNLSEKHPERAKQMAEKWEVWAIEANAKPWPWNRNKKSVGSKKKAFNLDANTNLTKELSPMIRKKPFEVEVHIEEQGEGILVAQGGDTHGWALFVRDNIVHFTLSLGGKIETIKADKELTEKEGKIIATLNPDGIVELFAGTRKLGSGKVSSLVKEMPIDGLQVGRDEGGTVGDYKDAFDFDGRIKKVRIRLN